MAPLANTGLISEGVGRVLANSRGMGGRGLVRVAIGVLLAMICLLLL